jgi:hypothetical protein
LGVSQEAWTPEVQAKLGDFMKGGAAEAPPPPAAPAAVEAAPAVAPAGQQPSTAVDEEALAAVVKNLHSAIRWCALRALPHHRLYMRLPEWLRTMQVKVLMMLWKVLTT